MNSKLRYYLRGIGIGMAVTALILTIVNLKNNRGEMTDAQIRERAAQLGMVDANSYSLTDAVEDGQAKTDDKTEEAKSEEKSEPAEENTEENTEEKAEDKKEETEPEETVTEDADPGEAEPAETEEVKPEEPQETEPGETKQEQPREGEATITIQNGSSSETACMLLKNAGLIDSADDLNRYMIQHGYDRTIHPGTFTLSYGLSFEEICRKIAG